MARPYNKTHGGDQGLSKTIDDIIISFGFCIRIKKLNKWSDDVHFVNWSHIHPRVQNYVKLSHLSYVKEDLET